MEYIKIAENACKELEKMADKPLSTSVLPTLNYLTKIVKNIYEIEMLKEAKEEGYSEDGGNWNANGSYARGSSYYDGESSYRRGRGRNAKRDYMGRYSREGGYSEDMDGMRSGYSRHDGKEMMISELEKLMHKADPESKKVIERCIDDLEEA